MANNRIRLTGSRAKVAGSATEMRAFSTMKSLLASRSWRRQIRPKKRSSIGEGLAWRSSIAAHTMAVRSPTSLATRK